jgi:N-acetylmuramoyl-L-alanine amidase-like protein
VRPAFLQRYGLLSLIAVSLALAAAVFGAPAPAGAPPQASPRPPTHAAVQLAVGPTAKDRPIATLAASAPATATPARPSAEPTMTALPFPTPVAPAASPRFHVGLQIGHWLGDDLPDELAHMHISTGTAAAGHAEVDVNLDIARRVAALLESIGVATDVLSATIPPRYDADAFVALHADGFAQPSARGFSVATAWAASQASLHLRDALTAEYQRATDLPRHDAATADMRGYYAFNYRRYAHAVAKTTPATIVEMGFLTNPDDRGLLLGQPDLVAIGIANGIVRYLNERDPNDTAALLPPDFGVWQGASGAGLSIRAAARDDARILLQITADRPVIPFEEREGWFRVVIAGAWDVVGWVRKDELVRIAGT